MNPDLPNPGATEATTAKLQAKVFLLWVFGLMNLHRVLLWVPFFIVFFLQFLQIFIVWSSISSESQIFTVLFRFIFFFYETRLFKTRVSCGKNISMSAIDLEGLRLDFFTELEPQRLKKLFSKLLPDSY